MNLELVKLRSQVVRLVRQYFDEQGFLEMFTPRLVGLPGQEPNLEPFWTSVEEAGGTKHEAALITSPEYAMKRLLAGGLSKIYDLGPCFRNGEPWDGSHDPEFLLLEWYRREADLEDILKDTEQMMKFVFDRCHPRESGDLGSIDSRLRGNDKRGGNGIKVPFRRLTVSQAMKQYAGVNLDELLDHPDKLAEVVRAHCQTVDHKDSFDDLFFKIFLTEVEPKLGWNDDRTEILPTFLTYYPVSMAALARRDPQDPHYALRSELYAGDLELANGFAELSDPTEQRARFLEERVERQKLHKKTWALDERFLSSLPDMGDAAGIAFGVDRLVMLLAGTNSITDVLPFSARERFQPEEERK